MGTGVPLVSHRAGTGYTRQNRGISAPRSAPDAPATTNLDDSDLADGDSGPAMRGDLSEISAASDADGRLELLGEIARRHGGRPQGPRRGPRPRPRRQGPAGAAPRQPRPRSAGSSRRPRSPASSSTPGIVPVYELGAFADRRPYFAMKLVKGRTLAALLSERERPGTTTCRGSSPIFQQVCQTMAYAHARGVIHRDLKPSNVMVGSFGEVQVMDWGLAKVLAPGGCRRRVAAAAAPEQMTRRPHPAERLGRRRVAGRQRAGHARLHGRPSRPAATSSALDERADVFGLGSILCEILTGDAALYRPGRQRGLSQSPARRPDRGACPARRLRRRCRADCTARNRAWPPKPLTGRATRGIVAERTDQPTWPACRNGCAPPSWPARPHRPARWRQSARPGPKPGAAAHRGAGRGRLGSDHPGR